jgi:KDO2-lipid IV(A) lauroyltransferase
VLVDLLLLSFIRVFQQFLRLLPERGARFVGVALGRMTFLVLKGRRKIALSNLKRIAGPLPEAEANATVRTSFENLGVNFVETLLIPYVPKEEYPERFQLENRDVVDEVLGLDRGILALVFHYGNWEIMGAVSSVLGREITVLARPLKKNPRLNAFLNRLRTETGLTIIPNADSARDVMRYLRQKHIVAIFGDQREKRSKGVFVEFFGEKVPTSKGITALAMKTGVPVMPVYMVRRGFLRYTFVYSKPLPIERKGDIDELIYKNTRLVNAFLEEIVRKNPAEWFLVHRRWGRDSY